MRKGRPCNSIGVNVMENKEKTQKKEKKEKVPRQAMPEQDPKKRIRNFKEVPYGYNAELAL